MRIRRDIARIAALGALLVGLALPAQALAEYYVPPGNSAANQYTESLPSAGGESSGGRGHGGGGTPTPQQSLGARNAKRLEAQGPAGEATAELAAETAPPAKLVQVDTGSSSPAGGQAGSGNGPNNGSGKQGNAQNESGGGSGSKENHHVNQPSGSSGIGELVSQATGSGDDGNLGLWLPLLIVATIAGSIGYRLRSRHGPTA
jgi:hypothetical protein